MNWGRQMSKIIFLIFLAGLTIAAVAASRINNVNAGQQPEFIQISVLAKNLADYGVDTQAIAIPAVSPEIIEDAAQDLQTQSSIQIITFTSLPTKEPKSDSEEQEGSDSVDEIKHNNGQGNGNGGGNGNQGSNGNGNGNQGNGGNGGTNDHRKDKEKERKPKKSN